MDDNQTDEKIKELSKKRRATDGRLMKAHRNRVPSHDRVKEIIDKCDGHVYRAAAVMGICGSHLYAVIRDNPELKKALNAVRDRVLDEAEASLRENVRKGDTASIIFTLKTIGKHRGYVERDNTANGINFEDLNKLKEFFRDF